MSPLVPACDRQALCFSRLQETDWRGEHFGVWLSKCRDCEAVSCLNLLPLDKADVHIFKEQIIYNNDHLYR